MCRLYMDFSVCTYIYVYIGLYIHIYMYIYIGLYTYRPIYIYRSIYWEPKIPNNVQNAFMYTDCRSSSTKGTPVCLQFKLITRLDICLAATHLSNRATV